MWLKNSKGWLPSDVSNCQGGSIRNVLQAGYRLSVYKIISRGVFYKFIYRVSHKTWEFSDEFDIVFVMN